MKAAEQTDIPIPWEEYAKRLSLKNFPGLNWPEVSEPQALIDFASLAITKVRLSGKLGGTTPVPKDLERLGITQGLVFLNPDEVYFPLDKHPDTGQGLLVKMNPDAAADKKRAWLAAAEDTTTPEIKLALRHLFPGALSGIASWREASTQLRDIELQDIRKNTWPDPTYLPLPSWPKEWVSLGLDDEVKVELTVTEFGLPADIRVMAENPELAGLTKRVVEQWKFEPGINRLTRLPVATRISLTVVFAGRL